MGKRQKGEPPFRLLQLLSDVELFDDRTVAVDVYFGQVVQQASSLTNQFQQTTSGVMVMFVLFQVLGQMVDSLGQDSDLYLGRTGIGLVQSVLSNDFLFSLLGHFSHL